MRARPVARKAPPACGAVPARAPDPGACGAPRARSGPGMRLPQFPPMAENPPIPRLKIHTTSVTTMAMTLFCS